jgi:hypothetical protein
MMCSRNQLVIALLYPDQTLRDRMLRRILILLGETPIRQVAGYDGAESVNKIIELP